MSQLVDLLKKTATEKTDNVQHLYREGTELDKGFVLTEDYLVSIEPFLRKQMEFYSAYPDLFLDQIKPVDDGDINTTPPRSLNVLSDDKWIVGIVPIECPNKINLLSGM